jgi:hypothetical protein
MYYDYACTNKQAPTYLGNKEYSVRRRTKVREGLLLKGGEGFLFFFFLRFSSLSLDLVDLGGHPLPSLMGKVPSKQRGGS